MLNAAYAPPARAFGKAGDVTQMSGSVRAPIPDNEPRKERARGTALLDGKSRRTDHNLAGVRPNGRRQWPSSNRGAGVKLMVEREHRATFAGRARGVACRRWNYGEARVATALNTGEFVPARARGATPLETGDRIKMV